MADHHTRSRIIRTTPASIARTSDLFPSRGWCPIANAIALCVSRTQLRLHDTEYTSFPTLMVWRSAPVVESHTSSRPTRECAHRHFRTPAAPRPPRRTLIRLPASACGVPPPLSERPTGSQRRHHRLQTFVRMARTKRRKAQKCAPLPGILDAPLSCPDCSPRKCTHQFRRAWLPPCAPFRLRCPRASSAYHRTPHSPRTCPCPVTSQPLLSENGGEPAHPNPLPRSPHPPASKFYSVLSHQVKLVKLISLTTMAGHKAAAWDAECGAPTAVWRAAVLRM